MDECDIKLVLGLEAEDDYGALMNALSSTQYATLLEHSDMKAKLLEEEPGFLGLSLPLLDAKNLLRFLCSHTAAGAAVPLKYREHVFPRAQALQKAESLLEEKKGKYPHAEWSELHLDDEGSVDSIFVYSFIMGSPTLRAEGYIPGAIGVKIDKYDGHVVGWKEMEEIVRSYTLFVEQNEQ